MYVCKNACLSVCIYVCMYIQVYLYVYTLIMYAQRPIQDVKASVVQL